MQSQQFSGSDVATKETAVSLRERAITALILLALLTGEGLTLVWVGFLAWLPGWLIGFW